MARAYEAQTPWGAKVDEVLADGEWHAIEAVVVAAMAAVPPGVSFRHGESERQRRRSEPGTRVSGDHSTSVATGARRLAWQAVRTRWRKGTAERDGEMVRRRP